MGQQAGDSSNGEARPHSTTLTPEIERSHRVHPRKKLRAPSKKYFFMQNRRICWRAWIFCKISAGVHLVLFRAPKLKTFDYKIFPQSQNKLWIRIENLADRFDLINYFEETGSAEVRRISINEFAMNLFKNANPNYNQVDNGVPQIGIEELTLAGDRQTDIDTV